MQPQNDVATHVDIFQHTSDLALYITGAIKLQINTITIYSRALKGGACDEDISNNKTKKQIK